MKYIITLFFILMMSFVTVVATGQPAFPEDPQQAPLPILWLLIMTAVAFGFWHLRRKY